MRSKVHAWFTLGLCYILQIAPLVISFSFQSPPPLQQQSHTSIRTPNKSCYQSPTSCSSYRQYFPSSFLLKASKNDSAQEDGDGMTTLHFQATKTFNSDPVPFSSYATIQTFLQQESNPIEGLLLSGSGMNVPQRLSLEDTMLLKDEWTAQTRLVGGNDPDPENGGDGVYQVTTGGINFAGLKVQSKALIGVKKQVVLSSSHDFPEYQLVYIKDEQFVEGPRILVWIFQKLTGKSGSSTAATKNAGSDSQKGRVDENGARMPPTQPPQQQQQQQQAVSSFSRFYVQITKNQTEAIFTIESMLDIAVKFPTFLLKILPVSKEKAEEQGSASVMKTLDKDTGASLQRVVDYYKQVAMVEKQAC